MAHFDEGSSLPPPFNIIITPKAIYYAFCAIVNTIKWLFGRYHHTKSRTRATIRVNILNYKHTLFQKMSLSKRNCFTKILFKKI